MGFRLVPKSVTLNFKVTDLGTNLDLDLDLDDNCQTPTDITAMRRVCTMDIVTSPRQSAGF